MNRETVWAEALDLGAVFLTHDEAAKRGVTNLGAWGRLLGYNQSQYVMTLRPYIIHPPGWVPHVKWQHLAHELVHFRRQPETRCGMRNWILKYGASNNFCAREEMHAHLMDLKTKRTKRTIPELVDAMFDWYRLGAWYRLGRPLKGEMAAWLRVKYHGWLLSNPE